MDDPTQKWLAVQEWKRQQMAPVGVSVDDPFAFPRVVPSNGYRNITIGKIGSGRSWATGLDYIKPVEPRPPVTPLYAEGLFDTLAAARKNRSEC